MAKNYNIEGDMTNHSSHVTNITRMDTTNILVKIMCLLIGHQNFKMLDIYNKTKELKACITQNVFHAPYDENTRVIVQYDEHAGKPMTQCHAKEVFGRGV
jgi:hypothetical protein